MPFFKEKKDILELQFEKPNINFLVDEESDAVRMYNIIRGLDFSKFYGRYKEKGGVGYKPEVLLGIILLSATEGVLSSRAIEKKCQRDVYYIYITEYRKPDHSTIARFIKKFDHEIMEMVSQVVKLAIKNNISSFQTIAIDGTKLQSKTSKKHSRRMTGLEQEEKELTRKISKLIRTIRENDKKENRDEKLIRKLEKKKQQYENRQSKIEGLKEELDSRRQNIRDKKVRENHQINIDEPDARMMSEIEANGYNLQFAVDTESEMIVSLSIETDRADSHQFSKQHKKAEQVLGESPERAYASDGGYYSEESFTYIEDNKLNAYINDSRQKEVIPSIDELLEMNKLLTTEHFVYSRMTNTYRCPNKIKLKQIKPGVYESVDCSACRIKHLCAQKANKRKVNRTGFTILKEKMRKKVKNNPDIMHKRKAVERVFGNLKWNLGFRRFTRKNITGAAVEAAIFALGLNLKKLVSFFFNLLSFINKIAMDKACILLKTYTNIQIMYIFFETKPRFEKI